MIDNLRVDWRGVLLAAVFVAGAVGSFFVGQDAAGTALIGALIAQQLPQAVRKVSDADE